MAGAFAAASVATVTPIGQLEQNNQARPRLHCLPLSRWTSPALTNPALRNGLFTVSLLTAPGWTYALESRDSADQGQWTPLSAVSGDGTVKTLTDPAATAPQRFYRVRSAPAGGRDTKSLAPSNPKRNPWISRSLTARVEVKPQGASTAITEARHRAWDSIPARAPRGRAWRRCVLHSGAPAHH
jgi:hypothetical protein